MGGNVRLRDELHVTRDEMLHVSAINLNIAAIKAVERMK